MKRRKFVGMLAAACGATAVLRPESAGAIAPETSPTPSYRPTIGSARRREQFEKQLRYQSAKYIGEMQRHLTDQFYGFSARI